MVNILGVCTANICRSPVFAALLNNRLHERGLEEWKVDSVGTWVQLERGAARYSIQVMREYGLDISEHVAKGISAQILAEADLIVCMEAGHAEALRIEFPEFADKVHLLSALSGYPYSVPDRYGQSISAFRDMAAEINGLIDSGLDKIIELAQENSDQRDLITNHR
ncbi:MAG: hypothetical protein R3293_16930 [Candidatus Promineifilaceae bacterium]|nr:hypothetical protein [Candidatus Promineifilaceae bacterium]